MAPLTALAALLVAALALSVPSSAFAQAPAAAGDGVDVLHYDARITPDLQGRTILGTVRIRATATAAVSRITLDRGVLEIDEARVNGVVQRTEVLPRRLLVHLDRPVPANGTVEIDVTFHGGPGFGLQFPPERSQVYTIFTTSDWMVCVDAPGDRATLRLRVTLPDTLTAAGVGRAMRVTPGPQAGTRVHEWRLDAPAPSYTFGFAAGPFTSASSGRLRFVGAGVSPTELRRVFKDTEAMLRFFERRAGVPYPHPTYTQALVARTVGQEMSGLSLLSEAYGRSVLADPAAVTLGAHEAAHQWWGNLLTCEAWTHFWLNEGMATFMAAAFLEEHQGRAAYDRAVQGWRSEYERVRNAGGDRSLVFPEWNRPSADDRTLVYQKGALVLHELRQVLGEQAFWAGLRAYTREHAGQSVTTPDLQRAMEAASSRDLTAFFAQWVYLRPPG